MLTEKHGLWKWLGIELDVVSLKEKFISFGGGLLSIVLVMVISEYVLHQKGVLLLIASMGASAVLLFGMPHGQLSQPWPVVMGHAISAFIGVSCARLILDPLWASGFAVGFSILAMHQFKCLHPPGGATALTAVVGGEGVRSLGYSFVCHPVLVNAVMMVAIAVGFNWFFQWRRYPAYFSRPTTEEIGRQTVTHQEVVDALESFDSFVDITEDDLIRLHDLLSKKRDKGGRRV